jgi:hypothetical protein
VGGVVPEVGRVERSAADICVECGGRGNLGVWKERKRRTAVDELSCATRLNFSSAC